MMENKLSPAPRFAISLELGFGLTLFALLVLAGFLYWPGLTGPLLLDDFWNLRPLGEGGGINNFDNFRQFVFGNDSGPTGRPVSMLSFLIDGQDWPPLVAAFKYTNLMLHLLCGLAICWMCYRLGQSLSLSESHAAQLALFVAGVWLIHPLNVSTTLYVVQRMTQLMTLFASLSLVFYLMGRKLLDASQGKALFCFGLCLFPFGLLSVLSKENGALLLLLIVLMELILFRGRQETTLFRVWYRLGVLLPLTIVVAYLIYSAPASMSLYDIRSFDLGERLLTETRALSGYLWRILFPNALGGGLFNDDIQVSTSLISPLTTLFSSMLLVALISSAAFLRKAQPVFSFAVFWFFAMHIIESSFIPLELYFEHRNYMAMIGPLFAVGWYLRVFLSSSAELHLKRTIQIFVGVLISFSLWLTWQLSNIWGDPAELYSYWAEEKPQSIRAQITYADYLEVVGVPELAMQRLEIANQYYPDEATILLYQWNMACEHGLVPPSSLQEIAENPRLEYYRDDINHHLQQLLENLLAARCEFPPQDVLVRLFERIGQFPLPDPRRAGFHFYFSDLYVYYGQLNPALINLSRAFELNPIPQIPIRQAVLSASAGNFRDALVFLDRAKQADQSRLFLLPSVMNQITALERDFQARLN